MDWITLVLAALLGAFCVLSLSTGLWLLIRNQKDSTLSQTKRRWRMVLAVSLLLGHLIVAILAIAFYSRFALFPLSTALGLLAGMLLFILGIYVGGIAEKIDL